MGKSRSLHYIFQIFPARLLPLFFVMVLIESLSSTIFTCLHLDSCLVAKLYVLKIIMSHLFIYFCSPRETQYDEIRWANSQCFILIKVTKATNLSIPHKIIDNKILNWKLSCFLIHLETNLLCLTHYFVEITLVHRISIMMLLTLSIEHNPKLNAFFSFLM